MLLFQGNLGLWEWGFVAGILLVLVLAGVGLSYIVRQIRLGIRDVRRGPPRPAPADDDDEDDSIGRWS